MSEPLNDKIAPGIEELIADGRPFIRCPCGFIAISVSTTENRWALEEHPCPNRMEEVVEAAEHHWYDRIFSFWGFLILFLIAYAVLAALGKAKW